MGGVLEAKGAGAEVGVFEWRLLRNISESWSLQGAGWGAPIGTEPQHHVNCVVFFLKLLNRSPAFMKNIQ